MLNSKQITWITNFIWKQEVLNRQVSVHLCRQEINPETYAICKVDMLLKCEGDAVDNIVGGSEYFILSNDAPLDHTFDFMLFNPSYGKSWKRNHELLGCKNGIKDRSFIFQYRGEELSLITRTRLL